MELILVEAVTQLIEKLKSDFCANTAISTDPDYEELGTLPAFMLEGMTLRPNNAYRRVMYEYKLKGATFPDNSMVQRRLAPQWHDLLFDGVLVTNNQRHLLSGPERFIQFTIMNPYFIVVDPDAVEDIELELTVGEPTLANTVNANRSGVQGITARFMLSALPIYAGDIDELKKALTREFTFSRIDGNQSEEVIIVPTP